MPSQGALRQTRYAPSKSACPFAPSKSAAPLALDEGFVPGHVTAHGPSRQDCSYTDITC